MDWKNQELKRKIEYLEPFQFDQLIEGVMMKPSLFSQSEPPAERTAKLRKQMFVAGIPEEDVAVEFEKLFCSEQPRRERAGFTCPGCKWTDDDRSRIMGFITKE